MRNMGMGGGGREREREREREKERERDSAHLFFLIDIFNNPPTPQPPGTIVSTAVLFLIFCA